jgi:hypothetical protein
MHSFFGDKDNVRVFSDGFDLLGDQSGSKIISDICADVRGLIEEDDDFYPAFFSLEALLTSLHDDQAAITLISQDSRIMDSPIFRFRYADHCHRVGDTISAEEILHSYMSGVSESLRDKIYGFLAAGRLGNAEEAALRWTGLLREEKLEDSRPDVAFVQNPDDYSLLAYQPFRERIEGVRLLIRDNIIPGREKEAYSLIRSLLLYNGDFLEGYLTPYMADEGGEAVLPGLWIAVLMSGTASKIVEEFLAAHIFPTVILHQGAEEILEDLREITREYLVRQLLIQGMVAGISDSDLLAEIRNIVLHRDDLILGPLEWIRLTEFQEQASSLIGVILEDNPDLHISGRIVPGKLPDFHKFRPGHRYDEDEDDEGWEEDQELESLLSESRYDEAFELVSGYVRNHVLFEDVEIIFNLALKSDRLDDIVSLRPFMEEGENQDGVYLIRAYERLMNRDVKGCLALIDRAVSVGYPEENAMILSAAFMNNVGLPKRAVGICEKLLKKQALPPGDIIPVLAVAYRLQGREQEAAELEDTL